MGFQNLSSLDRRIRLLVGLLMLWMGWTNLSTGEEIWPIALRIFAFFPLVTGILEWCPAYTILGLSTFRPKSPFRGP